MMISDINGQFSHLYNCFHFCVCVCVCLCVCKHSVPLIWMGRMTYCSLRNVFDSCVKSWHYFRADKILFETSFYWLCDDIFRFKIEVGVCFPCCNRQPQLLASLLYPTNLSPTQHPDPISRFATIHGPTDGIDDIICTNARLRSTDYSDADKS